MPFTLNGFGTWYYGKTGIRNWPGTCEFCGQPSTLSSYDATLYLTALFVPLLPLGKRKIFGECAQCRKHRVVRTAQWKQLREKEIAQAQEELRADPGNEEKALRLIDAAVAFQADEPLLVGGSLLGSASTAKVQAALGRALDLFGKHREAEAAFARALRLTDDPEVHEALAVSLMRQERPADARRHLQHLFDRPDIEQIGLIYLLVESYQAGGQHVEALNVLSNVAEKLPQLASDPEYQSYRALSEKHRTSGQRIPSPNLIDAPPQDRLWAARAASLVGPLLLGAVIVAYLVTAIGQGQSRAVHVVNGLDRPYTAQIGPRTVTLAPYQRQVIQIPEGEHTVQIQDGPPLPPQTFQIRTPLLTRPFRNDVYVVNPDTAAVLLWEQTMYSANPPLNAMNPYELHAGEAFYTFKEIDYIFEEFPAEIRIPGERAITKKQRLAKLADVTPLDVLTVILQGESADAPAAIVRLATVFPDEPQILFLLPVLFEPAEALPLMRQRLADRPILIEWHRAYQNTLEQMETDHDLHAEYAQYAQQEPGNPALTYLLARVTQDRAEQRRLMLESVAGEQPVAQAYYGLAYDELSIGNFDAALQLIRSAKALAPPRRDFDYLERQSLLATGRYEELLRLIRAEIKERPLDAALAVDEVCLLTRRRNIPGAREAIDRFVLALITAEEDEAVARYRERGFQIAKPPPTLAKADESEAARHWRRQMTRVMAYVQGDVEAFCRELDWPADASWRFAIALTQGRLDDAAAALEEYDRPDVMDTLILYVSAHSAGRQDLAEPQLQAAIELLRLSGRSERRFAQWLSAETPPDAAVVLESVLLPENKRILLAAMAARFPDDRQVYLSQASKLNYDRRFPHLALPRE